MDQGVGEEGWWRFRFDPGYRSCRTKRGRGEGSSPLNLFIVHKQKFRVGKPFRCVITLSDTKGALSLTETGEGETSRYPVVVLEV